MRTLLFILVPAILWAQSATTTYQTDVNGNRSALGTQERNNGDQTKRTQSVNGRQVPVEQSTDKVLSKDATGSTIERTVLRYDGTGRILSTERVLIEEKIVSGGGKVVTETASRADLNGRFQTTQRKTTETRVAGNQTTTNVTLDRPNVNGGFVTEEKRNTIAVGPKEKVQATEVVERVDLSGRFRPVERNETTSQTTGAQTTDNTATYALDATGKMALREQKVATTTARPDGGSVTETTVYKITVGASVQGPSGKMLPEEQLVVDRTVSPDGRVIEATSVRRADAADPGKLGPVRQISETVCTGKCLPPTPADSTATPSGSAAKAKN